MKPEPVCMNLNYEVDDFAKYDISSVPDSELKWSHTVCPYCGVGCGLRVGSQGNKLHKIRGHAEHPANLGLLCAKGATLAQVIDTPDRALYPLYRQSRQDEAQKISWNKALWHSAEAIRNAVKNHGPDSVAFYISGQLLTEDYYVINKFAKGLLGTNNVDSNSRLCMASAVSGYLTSLGADGPPACYEDLDVSNCFFLIGTNTAACHPVVFQRIKIRKNKDPQNVKVIVVDPRRTATCEIADLHLAIRPGTDVALLHGLMHIFIQKNLVNSDFIQKNTKGWDEIKKLIEEYTPEKTAQICDIRISDLHKAALYFSASPSTLSLWSMGVNQSSSGTAKNNAIINLHLATGKIGKPGSGPFSLTGQPNAMGGRETGGLCHLLPGHRFVAVDKHREEMEKFWGVPPGRISPKPGLHAVDLFKAVLEKKIKVLWVIATNPAVSMPDADRVNQALSEVDFLIVQDAYHPTETSRLAHLVLPAAQWSERDGTVTNSERCVSYAAKLIDPPGEARPDWEIVADVARQLDGEALFSFHKTEDVFEEYKMSTEKTDMDLSGLTYERLRQKPTQWPFPKGQTLGKKRLYEDGIFPTPDKKAIFHAHAYRAPAENTDAEYPMILTTGRVRDQWHTMTRTGKVDSLLASEPFSFIEIHPDDANKLDVVDGDWVRVITRRGKATSPARVTTTIRQGTCFMPFHWGTLFGDAAINRATHGAHDPLSKQPELKFCACKLEKVNDRIQLEPLINSREAL